jgi:hypothetical protein
MAIDLQSARIDSIIRESASTISMGKRGADDQKPSRTVGVFPFFPMRGG